MLATYADFKIRTRLAAFLEQSREAGVATTAIGTVTEGKGLPVFRFGGTERRYQYGSYSHFRDGA